MRLDRGRSLAMVELELPWELRIEPAHRAWERRLGRHEVVLGEEGHSLVAVVRVAAGRVEGGIAGPVALDRMAGVAAAAGEGSRHDEQEGHRMELAVGVKERRSIPAAVEEAGHSLAGAHSDPAGEGHHRGRPEGEHRIVVAGTEVVDSPGEHPGEAHPEEDIRRALVVLFKDTLDY